jgi:hypothetical protein
MDIKTYALSNRTTGKTASDPDARRLANRMTVIQLQKTGVATGIAALLIHEALASETAIKQASRTNRLRQVNPRRSRVTKGARDNLARPGVRAGILRLYFEHEQAMAGKNPSFRPPRTLKLMWGWLESSLTNRNSELFQYLSKNAPEISWDGKGCIRRRARGQRWWATQFAKHAIKKS